MNNAGFGFKITPTSMHNTSKDTLSRIIQHKNPAFAMRKNRKLFDMSLDHETNDTYICRECLGDTFLKKAIIDFAKKPCHSCQKSSNGCITIKIISTMIISIIEEHFEIHGASKTNQEPLTLGQVTAQIIVCSNTEICELIATHLLSDLADEKKTLFSATNKYQQKKRAFDSEEQRHAFFLAEWNIITTKLTHAQRYFNDDVQDFFRSLFTEATDATTETLFETKSTIVKKIDPGLELFRARRMDSPESKKQICENPEKWLGAPPKEAAGHNRMNSAGIPLFYAAKDRRTSIAEVRPSLGDSIAIGKFVTKKTLTFFDFTGFNYPWKHEELSFFENNYTVRANQREFLRYFHDIICQPVRSDGTGYIITQAMAEFLASKHRIKFDGIIYKSVQEQNGINYTIFSEKPRDSEITDKDWQPTFPVAFIGEPAFQTVTSISYECTPEKTIK
ncbi:RES family NAD+ phosphorylase [Pseudomonas sp. NPDC085632]|uniref:RES family NAD+ phosphorylase n=1 Tax=Pseudomonas sp. NPDC085632 TaxID=3364429 RepID=UPI0037C91CB4